MSHIEIVPGKKKKQMCSRFEKELLELSVGNTSWVMTNNDKQENHLEYTFSGTKSYKVRQA